MAVMLYSLEVLILHGVFDEVFNYNSATARFRPMTLLDELNNHVFCVSLLVSGRVT